MGETDFYAKITVNMKKIPSFLAAVILIALWISVFVIRPNIRDFSDNAAFYRESEGWLYFLIALYSGGIAGLFRPWRWYLSPLLFLGCMSLHYLSYPVMLSLREVLGLLVLWYIGWIPCALSRWIIDGIVRSWMIYDAKRSQKEDENSESMAETT